MGAWWVHSQTSLGPTDGLDVVVSVGVDVVSVPTVGVLPEEVTITVSTSAGVWFLAKCNLNVYRNQSPKHVHSKKVFPGSA